jgi:hypothetical protein
MKPGSVIVDLAAERGGNCELTRCDETVEEHGVTIVGPANLPSEHSRCHASADVRSSNIADFPGQPFRQGRVSGRSTWKTKSPATARHPGRQDRTGVAEVLGIEIETPAKDTRIVIAPWNCPAESRSIQT